MSKTPIDGHREKGLVSITLMGEPAEKVRDMSEVELHHLSRVIAETASDAILTIDDQSNILFANPAAEKIFGYDHAEMIGKSLTMLMPEYLRHFHRSALERYVVTGKRHLSWEAVSLPGLHKNGREIPLELSFGEFTENGRRLFTGIARDITERRKLERRLTVQVEVARIMSESDSLEAAAPRLLKAVSESLGCEMGQLWGLDREAKSLRWVAAWRVTSLAADEFEEASRNRSFPQGVGLPGRIWANQSAEWIEHLSKDANFPRWQFIANTGLTSAFGFPIVLGHTVMGVMEFFSREDQAPDPSLLEIMNGLGNQIGQFVERKRAEDERGQLFEREQRARLELEATMERMRQVQTVTETALAHLSLDKLFAELIDRVREAMDVDTVVILLMEGNDELVAWATKGVELDVGIRVPLGAGFGGRVAQRKEPIIVDDIETADLHTPFLREHGVKCLLGVPLLIEGRVVGVIHVGRLVRRTFTEDDARLLELVAFRVALAIDNARLFEEERAARREAEVASRAKDEFLTTISHELRTPLTPIIGWIHMIRNGLLPQKEATHGLEVIEKNSHSLKRLINDLLDMSAILSGKMRMEEMPLRLEGVVREAMETVRPTAAARDVELELVFKNWQNEIVSGDRIRLGQAFANLLDNAIKFSPTGGRVKVLCETNETDAFVQVEDSGQGIAEEFIPFVFDRFRQEDGSKTRRHGGLGLGLALVKSFVEAHQGSVKVASAGQGHGSRFTVRLPRRRDLGLPSESERAAKVDVAPPAHLMIIEDDPDTLEMLRATLLRHGFQVTACDSASETLRVAPEQQVDLIISDIGMPAMDGFEMIQRLRELDRYQSVPAIALSGYASHKDAKTALAAGFNAHVSKPVDPSELIALVNRLLAKPASTDRGSRETDKP
ncbi:MAG: GAF domain-containing protein [Pyrinomonadaceae bacterium]